MGVARADVKVQVKVWYPVVSKLRRKVAFYTSQRHSRPAGSQTPWRPRRCVPTSNSNGIRIRPFSSGVRCMAAELRDLVELMFWTDVFFRYGSSGVLSGRIAL